MSGFEAWAVRALAAGGLVLLAGYLLAKLCRGPARRQAAVAWAVRGAVLAAAVAALPGWLPVTLPAPAPLPAAPVVPVVEAAPLVWEYVVDADSTTEEPVEVAPSVTAAVAPTPAPGVLPDWPTSRWLAVGYAAVVAAFLARLAVGHLALARLTRRASPAPPRVKQRFAGRVFVADRVSSPVCFGVLRPTVLLPRGLAETASAGELDWVLAHEADHLRRGDHRSTWWAAVAGCVFFPLPWFWAVRRELVLAQEFLADAAAAGDRPADYAAYLVHLSASPVRLPQLAAGVRAGRSDLSRRVTMLLNDGDRPRRASRAWRLLVGSGAVAGAVALGGLTVRPAAADEPKAEPEPLEIRVEVRLDDDKPADKKADEEKDKKKAAEEKQKRVVITADGKANAEKVAKLKEEIKAAAKKGDDEKVADLVEKLEKALRAQPKVLTLDAEGKGPARITGRLGGDGKPMQSQGNAIDEAIKQLKAQLDAMKDGNPQAREAMEQAIQALKGQAMNFRGGGQNFEWQKVPGPADPFAQKPRFGAGVEPVSEAVREQLDLGEKVGVQVAEVKDGTPAAKAGLKKGDVIASFAGKDVSSDPEKFAGQVRTAKAGETKVVVIRKGKKQTLTVDLPDAPKPSLRADAVEGQKLQAEETMKRAEDQVKKAKLLAEEQVKRAVEQAKRAEEQAKRAAERAKRDAELAIARAARTAQAQDGGDFRSISISVTDGKFTAQATNAGIEYRINGRLEDGKAVPEKIVVKEGEQTHTGKAIKDIPENCHNALERLLSKVTPPKS